MSSVAHSSLLGFARSGRGAGGVHFDLVTLALTLGIVLLGLVMVTSASVSIAGQATGEPFYYLERQLLLTRSEEHTSELQSLRHLVCRLLLEKKKTRMIPRYT